MPTVHPCSGVVPVRLEVWGETDRAADDAVDDAGFGWSRETWDFVEITRHVGVPCPIDFDDPSAIASERHYGRGYVAYRGKSR